MGGLQIMELIYGGIIGIVGIILGSKLTNINESKSYRRDKLEQLALSLGDYMNVREKQHTLTLNILSNQNESIEILEDFSESFEEQNNKINYFKTMSVLHAEGLLKYSTQYLNKISSYDKKVGNILEDDLNQLKFPPFHFEPIDTTEIHKLYLESMDTGDDLISKISNEIYKKSWLEKLNVL